MKLRIVWGVVALAACKPAETPIREQPMSKRELPGVTLSMPPATHEKPDLSWYSGEAFSRLKAGGYVHVLWRVNDPPTAATPEDPDGERTGLIALMREGAKRMGDKIELMPPAETTVGSHRAVTAEVVLEKEQRARLTSWFCPEDGRLLHVVVAGAGLEVNGEILGSLECHTWSKERRAQTLRTATFEAPEGFVRVEAHSEANLRWERGPEVMLLSFGLPTSPANALIATRRSLPVGLMDLKETVWIGPDQRPRARMTGELAGDHTTWRYTWDLLDCEDRVYLATHSIPKDHEVEKPHPLERVRCPGL